MTIADVAKVAGVSRQTVSRAINNKGEISAHTRERVLEAVEQLGYRPSRVAQGLASKHTRTIGLVLADITNPCFPQVARGAQDAARLQDYSLFLGNTDNSATEELRTLESFIDQGVDGIISFPALDISSKLEDFVNNYRPFVFINHGFEHPHVSLLMVDTYRGAKLAVEHLVDRGHTAIAMLGGPSILRENVRRVEGFQDALEANGLLLRDDYIISTYPDRDHGYEATLQLLSAYPEITAIFAYNDLLALGAIKACQKLGRRVPDDAAIVGFDDIYLASMVTPALTTIRTDKYEIGRQAMQRLLQMIENPEDVFPPIQLDVELVVRGST